MTCLADALPSRGKPFEHPAADKPVYLLTVHYHFHILDKAVHDLEGLGCGNPSLIHGESV